MDETNGSADSVVHTRGEGGLNRRNMLKAAAAAGVGAAAWSAPNVTTLGFAPAYAQTGSPFAELFTDASKINANGSGPCNNWGQGNKAESASFSVGGIGPMKVEMTDPVDADLCIDENPSGRARVKDNGPAQGNNPAQWCYVTGYNLSCGTGGSNPNVFVVADLTPSCTAGGQDAGQNVQGCPSGTGANSFVFFQIKCYAAPLC